MKRILTLFLLVPSALAQGPGIDPTPISELPAVIDKPGAYFLTKNLLGKVGQDGIRIVSPGVDLNLNGFTLTGVPGSGDGIEVTGNGVNGVTIQNGTLRLWDGKGVNISPADCPGGILRGLKVFECASDGISGGSNGLIEGCTATQNDGHGIQSGNAGIVRSCTSLKNGLDGFRGSQGAEFSECTAEKNQGKGFSGSTNALYRGCTSSSNGSAGFQIGTGSLVSECISNANGGDGYALSSRCQLQESVAESNLGRGVVTAMNCTILGCTVQQSSGNGIEVGGRCRVANCHVGFSGGGVNANTAAIQLTGIGTVVEGNTMNLNGNGVRGSNVSSCVIVRNTSVGNLVAYFVPGSNMIGPIVTQSNFAANTHPQANFNL